MRTIGKAYRCYPEKGGIKVCLNPHTWRCDPDETKIVLLDGAEIVPVLGVGAFLGIGNALGFINYTVIWRYFSWTNQTLAMIVLWAASMYLFQEKKNYWITAVPATFMSAVSSTYFVLAPECLGSILNSKTAEGATIYNTAVAYPFGVIFAIAMLAIFLHATKKNTQKKAA